VRPKFSFGATRPSHLHLRQRPTIAVREREQKREQHLVIGTTATPETTLIGVVLITHAASQKLQRIPIRVRAKRAHNNSDPLTAATIVEDVEKGHSDFLMFGCGEVDLHKSVQIDDRRLRND
jgi:hypothetical protein